MSTARVVLATVMVSVWAVVARAQVPIQTRVAFFSETYSFDPGLIFQRINEYTVPLGITVPFGEKGEVALSTGYAHVVLRSASPQQLADQQLSGFLDTEARVSWHVVPGRLTLLATGAIPTGITTVSGEELSVLGALASDIIGFISPNLGSGAKVGFGFAGAVPIGSWAIGLGATVREAFRYTAITGSTSQLKPGREVRVRGGLEGRMGQRTYLRAATVYSHRAKDLKGDSTQNGIGNRIVGYLSINQGIGNTSLSVYGFDVFRGSPQIEETALGAAVLPRGNLIGAGFTWFVPITRHLSVTPRGEFRNSAQDLPLRLAGRSWRGVLDLRFQITPQFAVVGQAGGVRGFLIQESERIQFDGLRTAVHIELIP